MHSPIAGNSLRDSWWSYSVWVALSYRIDVIFCCRLRWPMEDHSHAHASLLKRGRYRYKTSIRNLYKVYQLLHNDKFLQVRLYFKLLSTCQSAVQSLFINVSNPRLKIHTALQQRWFCWIFDPIFKSTYFTYTTKLISCTVSTNMLFQCLSTNWFIYVHVSATSVSLLMEKTMVTLDHRTKPRFHHRGVLQHSYLGLSTPTRSTRWSSTTRIAPICPGISYKLVEKAKIFSSHVIYIQIGEAKMTLYEEEVWDWIWQGLWTLKVFNGACWW